MAPVRAFVVILLGCTPSPFLDILSLRAFPRQHQQFLFYFLSRYQWAGREANLEAKGCKGVAGTCRATAIAPVAATRSTRRTPSILNMNPLVQGALPKGSFLCARAGTLCLFETQGQKYRMRAHLMKYDLCLLCASRERRVMLFDFLNSFKFCANRERVPELYRRLNSALLNMHVLALY